MSDKGKKTAERVSEFVNILKKYDVSSIYGHYLDLVIELEKDVEVSAEDVVALNKLDAFNDLGKRFWRIYH